MKSKPDLTITNISIINQPVKIATWTNFQIEIKNQGTAKYFSLSNVELSITDSSGKNTGCDIGLPQIDPGQTTTSISCIVYTAGQSLAVFKVDANNNIFESNESNNTQNLNFYVYL